MKVFISWSGEASRSIASKLYDWLPMVLQSVQPYMSSESIDKGTRWASSIANELEDTGVGIVVLTPDNLEAPWIYFEAGALAKAVGDSKLAPLLCGLKPSDIGTPLSQFQVTVFNKDDVLKLLKSINACSGDDALPESRLEKMHNALWGELSSDVEPIIAKAGAKPRPTSKTTEDDVSRILEELLVLSRQQAQVLMNPEKLLSREAIKAVVEISSDYESIDTERVRFITHALLRRWRDLHQQIIVAESDETNDERRKQLSEAAGRVDFVIVDLVAQVEGRRGRRHRAEVDARGRNIFAQPAADDASK
jgi:hypothetical protein